MDKYIIKEGEIAFVDEYGPVFIPTISSLADACRALNRAYNAGSADTKAKIQEVLGIDA